MRDCIATKPKALKKLEHYWALGVHRKLYVEGVVAF
jgi:hypothetical protein